MIQGMIENGYSNRDINYETKPLEFIEVKAKFKNIKIPYLSVKAGTGDIRRLSYKNILIHDYRRIRNVLQLMDT